MLPPTAAAPMIVLDPRQIDAGLPAAAAGNGLTVNVTGVLLTLLQFVVVFLASA